MTAVLDTNILIRHLTGEPPDQARRAGRLLASGLQLALTDVVLAEVVFVLRSVYRLPRSSVAQAARAIVGFESIVCAEPHVAMRAIELYGETRLAFADAHVVAVAEATGADVASFDRGIDRVATVRRVEP